jgi:hypothetical protein
MKKVEVIFLIILFSSLALANFEGVSIHNNTIQTNYPLNQILRGDINISFDNINIDSIIRSNKGHYSTLRDLLKKDSAIYSCIPNDCSNGFKIKNGGSNLDLPLNPGVKKIFGFYIYSPVVQNLKLNFDILSDFEESANLPLTLSFFESEDNSWRFNKFSGTKFRRPYYGDGYQNGKPDTGTIGSGTYCSKLYVHETDRIIVGANLTLNDGEGLLRFKMYTESGLEIEESISYDPNNGERTVSFMRGEQNLFDPNFYIFCLEAVEKSEEASYKLFVDKDNSSFHSSFSFVSINENNFHNEFNNALNGPIDKSYSIFVQEALYAHSDLLTGTNLTKELNNVSSYLAQKYKSNCSKGCFFPIKVYSTIQQNFKVTNPKASFFNGSNIEIENIYELERIPTKASFSGILDFMVLNFKMNQTGEHIFYLEDEDQSIELFKKNIKITQAPVILGIYPDYIPAGIESKIFVELDYDGNKSLLDYEWELGDGTTKNTNSNEIFHRYENISTFNIKVTVKMGNLSNNYEKLITSINPIDYVHLIYNQLQSSLNETTKKINTFPTWIQPVLKSSTEIKKIEEELGEIKRKIEKTSTSLNPEDDYLEIAKEITTIDFATNVFVSREYTFDFPLSENIDLKGLSEYTGEELEQDRDDNYSNAIIGWQKSNVEFTISAQKFSLNMLSGSTYEIFTKYNINVRPTDSSFDDEYYLILNLPNDKINLKDYEKTESSNQQTIFKINEGESKTIEFYVLGTHDLLNFFASPEIDKLELDVDIDKTCNFNYICEPERGEDSKNCRSDCKPVGLMIFYIILAIIFALILYTVIQIWYLKHYENMLFKDKNRLYNLIMYVTAAQQRGMSREDIKKSLREKGWTSERIEFVIRKANGERIGLYELIPISKITANSRKKQIITNKGLPPQRPVPIDGRSLNGHRIMRMPSERPGMPPLAPPEMKSQAKEINTQNQQRNNEKTNLPNKNLPLRSDTPNNQQQKERNINKDNNQDLNKTK